MKFIYKFLSNQQINSSVWIFFIFFTVTLININKAIHIDDTAYIEVAKGIIANPLHPMQFLVNWEGSYAPVSKINQPHLLSYLIVPFILLFKSNHVHFPIFLHLIIAIFSFFAIYFFYRLTVMFEVDKKHQMFLTALFALGPAFIVNQNVMTDIPMLALSLASVWSLKLAITRDERLSLSLALVLVIAAGIFCGFAILTKYTALVMIVVLSSLLLFSSRDYKKKWTWVIIIPITMIVLWSLFNYYDYGHIHILDRPRPQVSLYEIIFRRGKYWLAILGAILPIGIIAIPYFFKNISYKSNFLFLILFISLPLLVYFEVISDRLNDKILSILFLLNGISIFILLIHSLKNIFRDYKKKDQQKLFLYIWFFAGMSFAILFSPFLATRHLLISLPPLLLILGLEIFPQINNFFLRGILVVTVFLGVTLGISDYYYADTSRKAVEIIKNKLHQHHIESGNTIWFVGHWGWQWYASNANANFKHFDLKTSIPKSGDIFLIPYTDRIDKKKYNLTEIFVVDFYREKNLFALFTTALEWPIFYASKDLPWSFRKGGLLNRFEVYFYYAVSTN
ncbi:MAG: glycosyltransferase family 39 protein [Oligoflexia bacterium]|nr:glycosyltransferase family 39 protein [Oligoflexia bacterium]